MFLFARHFEFKKIPHQDRCEVIEANKAKQDDNHPCQTFIHLHKLFFLFGPPSLVAIA